MSGSTLTIDVALRNMWDRYAVVPTSLYVSMSDYKYINHVHTHHGYPRQRGASIRKLKKLAYRRGYTRNYVYQGDFE